MEGKRPELKWYKCRDDDMLPEKLLLKKLVKLGEITWQ